MAWGTTPAEPLPQAYNNDQAEEWGAIANYSVSSQESSMAFLGPLSQHQACADIGDPCTGTDNTPDQSWDDLYNALNCSSGCLDPQTPPHVSNIRWTLTETK